jgi:hypothetical protein
MKQFNILKNRILWVVFYLFSTLAFAIDDDPGFPMNNDPGQQPVAPIDDYIIPAMVLILLYGFYKHYKRKKLTLQHK